MQASLSGSRRGICLEMPSTRPRASTNGCGFLDDAVPQAERDRAIVAQLPEPLVWIPRPTGLLHPGAHRRVGEGDAQPDDLVVGEATAKRGRGGSQWRSAMSSSTVLSRFFRCAS